MLIFEGVSQQKNTNTSSASCLLRQDGDGCVVLAAFRKKNDGKDPLQRLSCDVSPWQWPHTESGTCPLAPRCWSALETGRNVRGDTSRSAMKPGANVWTVEAKKKSYVGWKKTYIYISYKYIKQYYTTFFMIYNLWKFLLDVFFVWKTLP